MMWHLTIKNLVFVIVLLIGLAPVHAHGFKNEPDGFESIKWGDSIESIKGMKFLYTKDAKNDISVYTKESDITHIGKARVSAVEYEFYRKRFVSVRIKIDDLFNFIKLKKHCFEKYGKGIEITPGLERYYWDGERTIITLVSNFEIS